MTTSLDKLRKVVRYHLQGAASVDAQYNVALDAFNYMEKMTDGKFRADGKTPEFIHPLSVTALLMTLQSSLMRPADTFAAALLHDGAEDLGISIEYIRDRFGRGVAHPVMRVSKVIGGVKTLSLPQHFLDMGDCPVATVLKGADRGINQSTMDEPFFPPQKQLRQAAETEQFILPMLKDARRAFPAQSAAYENLKFLLTGQIRMIRAHHGSTANASPATS